MKPPYSLLFTVSFLTLFCFSSKSQNKSPKYTEYDWGLHYYYYKGILDSAFFWFDSYVNKPDDTLNKARAYNYMGQIQWQIGDLYGAQESLISAIKTLNPHNNTHDSDLAYSYNLLGNISLDLKLYDEAISYFDTALVFAKRINYAPEVMNGKATAFQKKGKYNNAIALYDSILALNPDQQDLVARAIDNRAMTRWRQNNTYPALPELHLALKIRTDSNYSAGLNASYAHLADYYEKSNPDSALFYAQKMREQAIAIKSPGDVLEAMDKLIALNNSAALKSYWYKEFKRLNDSLQFSRDTTRSRFASLRYGVEKSKADNLALQQHITKQRVLTVAIVIGAIALITALLLWFHRRRQKLKRDAEKEIQASRLKTSQKIHDVVANGLYKIMNELEHRDEIDKEPLLNKIEGLYEQSRDISYEPVLENNAEYDQQIHQLLTSFANMNTKVIVIGNQQSFWGRITLFQKQELQLVLEEIMINMQKHSRAKNVVIHFKQEDSMAYINYKDDGRGFPPGVEFGNGLNNTVSRIKSLKGRVSFGKSSGEGVSIVISFPLESINHD